jgi:YVTN family beta-propeller protein
VANSASGPYTLDGNTVSVIDAASETVIDTITVGVAPNGIAVTPDSSRVYVGNIGAGTVSVIDAAQSAVVVTISGLSGPNVPVVSPDGKRVYVTETNDSAVAIIDTSTDSFESEIEVGPNPFGIAFVPEPKPLFSGTPGKANCRGKSVSALAIKYDGIALAAEALNYPSVAALQNAIRTFCEG